MAKSKDQGETTPRPLLVLPFVPAIFAVRPRFTGSIAGGLVFGVLVAVLAPGLALSTDLILGRVRVVVFAALDEHSDEQALAERLAQEALDHGLSVARIDAGSRRPTIEPGLTDLAADMAGFGDVVFKDAHQQLAEIPWGHLATLDTGSPRPATLVEALSDIYEVVLVMTGPFGRDDSAAPIFATADARLVLVGSADRARLDACRDEALRLGYEHIEALAVPAWRAEVA